jgi:DNA repair exonuclease SbcCD ATPase subunit
LLAAAKQIFENVPEYSKTKLDNIESANKEIVELENEKERISAQIGIIKKRLNDVKRLKSGLIDYGNSQRKRADRLHISLWLESVTTDSLACPACGSAKHPNSKSELSKVVSAFKKYEDQSRSVAEIPTSFSREEERIKSDLQILLDKKEKLQRRFDLVLARDKNAQEEFQRKKNMFLFLGHLKASIETFERLVDGGDFEEEISMLEIEYNRI